MHAGQAVKSDIPLPPSGIWPKEPFHEAVIRTIINERADHLGRNLTRDDLAILAEDMRSGNTGGGHQGSMPSYSDRITSWLN